MALRIGDVSDEDLAIDDDPRAPLHSTSPATSPVGAFAAKRFVMMDPSSMRTYVPKREGRPQPIFPSVHAAFTARRLANPSMRGLKRGEAELRR